MLVNIALLSDKDKSVDNLKKAIEKEGFEVLEMSVAFKQLVKE